VIKEHGRRECPFLELTELTAGFRKRSKIIKLGRFIVFFPLEQFQLCSLQLQLPRRRDGSRV